MIGRSLLFMRILSVDPTPRGFGFVVLEGPDGLIDWGVREVGTDNATCLRAIVTLIDRYQPDVVVVEQLDDVGVRCRPRAHALIQAIVNEATTKRLRCRVISRLRIQKTLGAPEATTKYQIALTVARRLPELEPRLPPPRKLWMSEDSRMAIFDAAALALTCFHDRRRARRSTSS